MLSSNSDPPTVGNRPRIGLALSGGGMRAMLFHLGVVRYLRDTGRLQDVTHVCSVSGGSVLAAHMGINWDEYLFDYDATGPGMPQELISFAEHDVRNRIFRRAFLRWMLLRHSLSPACSTTNLLRGFYDRLLFHGATLSALKPRPWKADDLTPHVHLLTTAMEMGALASFSHEGLQLKFDQVEPLPLIPMASESLATAVAASSAFPMFFPPVKFTPEQFGGTRAEFCDRARLLLNDGGVFDNLGISPFLANESKWQCSQVIVSDASRISEIHNLDGRWSMINHVAGLNRAYDIAATRLYRHQLRSFPANFVHISIQNAAGPARVPHGMLTLEDRLRLKEVRTDFDALPGHVIRALVVHGQALRREKVSILRLQLGKQRDYATYKHMKDDCIYWDPRLRQSGGQSLGLPAAALPAVAGHPVQSLFFSLDPWAIFSVIFYSASVMLLWAGLVFVVIRLATAAFAPQPLYVCRIEAVRSNSNWFNLTSTASASARNPQAYEILFDEELPNRHGLLFVNVPNEGPICLTITASGETEETESFVVDWSTAPPGTQIEPLDLVSQHACVYFGDSQPAKAKLEQIETDFD